MYAFVNPEILFSDSITRKIVMNMCRKLTLVIFRAASFEIIKVAYHLNNWQKNIG